MKEKCILNLSEIDRKLIETIDIDPYEVKDCYQLENWRLKITKPQEK